MSTKAKSTSKFSYEMDCLIKSIAELTIKEGYKISSIKNAISSEIVALLPSNQTFKFENTELEKKLIDLFDEKTPEWAKQAIERMVVICEAYYMAREKSSNVEIGELAPIVAKRFSLKESSARSEITTVGIRLREWIFQDEASKRLSTKDALEKFYLTYMK